VTARAIFLNDQILELTPDDEIPDFEPITSDPSPTLTIPAFQIAFWVFVEPRIGHLCAFK